MSEPKTQMNRTASAEDHVRKIGAYVDARPGVEKIEITPGIYQLLYDNFKRLSERGHEIELRGKRLFVKQIPLICGHLTPADRAWLEHHKRQMETLRNGANPKTAQPGSVPSSEKDVP